MVTHKHIVVNKDITNIPSYALKVGDIISVREKSKSLEMVGSSLAATAHESAWLEWNSDTMTGKVLVLPEREQIPENIKEQLIVELYSK